MFKKYLHEPLVHFLVLGGLIFFSYAYLNDDVSLNDTSIVLTKAEVKQLKFRWQKKHLREPSEEELQTLIDQTIYAEVMYREALTMGLDKNDLIIKRRLTQKLEFVTSDMGELLEPSDETLLTYMSKHADRFKLATKMHFSQIYINPRKHKGTQNQKLEEIESLLKTQNPNSVNKGDVLAFSFEDKIWTQKQVQAKLGKEFAKSLFTVDQTTWQGPLKSAYGLHFVKVESNIEGELPKLETIRTVLKNEWMTAQREKNNQAFYKVLKSKYTIEIEQ